MSAGWVVYGLIVSVLVAGAALMVDAIQRARGGRQRWIWVAALAVAAALQWLAPVRARTTSVTVASRDVGASGAATLPSSTHEALDGPATLSVQAMLARVDRATGIGGQRWIRAGILASEALALLFMVGTYVRVVRMRRRLPTARLFDVTVNVSERMGPVVAGLRRPVIVVPRWFLGRSPDEQRLVLAHEREHIRAGDPMLLAIGAAALVLFPWNPVFWLMAGRLRLAVELDCDRRVMRGGVAPQAYGAMLVDMAARCSDLSPALAGLSARRSHLEWRLRTMTDSRPTLSASRVMTGAAVAALLLVVACRVDVPTAVAAADAATAERAAREVGMVRAADSVTYRVDGTEVSGAEAKAIDESEIASIEVKRPRGLQAAEILITKLKADASRGPDTEIRATPSGSGSKVLLRDRSSGTATVLTRKQEAGLNASLSNVSPLILVDGIAVDSLAMQALRTADILSVEVIKGPAARAMSGDARAANGIIIIRTK